MSAAALLPPPPTLPADVVAPAVKAAAEGKARGGGGARAVLPGAATTATSKKIADLKAYYDEVDNIVLEVEEVAAKPPSPPWAIKAAPAPAGDAAGLQPFWGA